MLSLFEGKKFKLSSATVKIYDIIKNVIPLSIHSLKTLKHEHERLTDHNRPTLRDN